MLWKILSGASLLLRALAQTPPSEPNGGAPTANATYIDPAVSRGIPVPGNYTGALRPQVHFSPPQHFMNDPNGMFVDANGTWHLYYQYNPTGLVAGNQHWGHATSPDLYHWENQPIALFPPNNFTYVFSGSCVIDVNNTSGFFPNQDNGVVAIYTLAEYPGGVPGPQQQAIAYSNDGGYSFTPYAANPVIPSQSSQFRDPKVTWYQDHWVMVIAYAQEFAIGVFTSPDLKTWTAASNFSYHGLLGAQYECPNLVEVPINGTNSTKHVLAISINPGAPLGGSVQQYFIGDFNGTHFTPMDGVTRLTDFGKDNYAGQFFYGTGGTNSDAISIAWASNWQYTQVVPTAAEGWRSAMSLPRRQFLAPVPRVGLELFSAPFELGPVLGPELARNDSLANGTLFLDFATLPSNAVYLQVLITNLNSTASSASATVNFTLANPYTQEFLRGGYYLGGDNPFFLDRSGLRGFENPFFTDKFSVAYPLDPARGSFGFEAVWDRSMLEVFVDGGARVATLSAFPTQPLSVLTVGAGNIAEGVGVSVRVWGLERAWERGEDEAGTVRGNVTQSSLEKRHKRLLYEADF